MPAKWIKDGSTVYTYTTAADGEIEQGDLGYTFDTPEQAMEHAKAESERLHGCLPRFVTIYAVTVKLEREFDRGADGPGDWPRDEE